MLIVLISKRNAPLKNIFIAIRSGLDND